MHELGDHTNREPGDVAESKAASDVRLDAVVLVRGLIPHVHDEVDVVLDTMSE